MTPTKHINGSADLSHTKLGSDLNSNQIEAKEQSPPSASGGKIFRSTLSSDLNEEEIAKFSSLGHYLIGKLETDNADATVLLDAVSGRQWLGKDLKVKILNVAAALVDKHQLKPGQTVCISHDHSDICCILALGIICAGGIVACAFPKDPYAELLYLARKVEPKLLFCHRKNLTWAKQLSEDLKYPVVGVAMGELNGAQDSPMNCGHINEYLEYDYKTASCSGSVPVAVEDLKRQVSIVTMSSGTTGKPKVVPTTHWNCIGDLASMARGAKGSFFAFSASLDYVSGRIILLGAIQCGYTAVVLNGFEPKTFLEAIERYKITIIYIGAASFYNLITHEQLDDYDISSVKMVFPMGAKIIYLEELAKFFKKHPNIVAVRQGYGASELSGVAMSCMSPEVYLKSPDNCGLLFPGVSAKIVDKDTGELCGPNKEGIIHISSSTVFPGYYDLELARERGHVDQLTGQLDPFVGGHEVFDEDGFYISGDIAYFNDKEELFIVGRHKELMSCRGAKKVLPQELEEVIELHPAVSKVCVIGKPNQRELTLHCPRAFVVCKPNYYSDAEIKLTSAQLEASDEQLEHRGNHQLCLLPAERRRQIAEDLMAFVNKRVGWEKQLTGGIVILDDMPTSKSTGKVDKGFLRALSHERVEIYGDRSG